MQSWEVFGLCNIYCAMICAKWALDLGVSRVRQVIFLIGGLLFGPAMMLCLYVYLLRKAKKDGQPGGQTV